MSSTAPFTLYTDADLQSMLGLSRETLSRYRRKGFLPYTKLGLHVRYTPAQIEAFITSRSRGNNLLQGNIN